MLAPLGWPLQGLGVIPQVCTSLGQARLDQQLQDLAAGSVAVLPKGIPHTYFVSSPTATIVEVIAPGGLEQAFREAGWDLHTPT